MSPRQMTLDKRQNVLLVKWGPEERDSRVTRAPGSPVFSFLTADLTVRTFWLVLWLLLEWFTFPANRFYMAWLSGSPQRFFFGRIFVSGFSEKKGSFCIIVEKPNKQITVCPCQWPLFLHLSSRAGGLGLGQLFLIFYLGSTMKNTESHRKSEINRLTKPSHGE